MTATAQRSRWTFGRAVVCLVVWVVALVGSLWIASETTIGSVLHHLSGSHGIHAGDVIAVMAGVVLAGLFSVIVLAPGAGRSRET